MLDIVVLNGVIFLLSIFLVERLLFPCLDSAARLAAAHLGGVDDTDASLEWWLARGLVRCAYAAVYYGLWLLPMYAICLLTNAHQVAEVAAQSFQLLRRRKQQQQLQQQQQGLGAVLSDVLYDTVVPYSCFLMIGGVDLVTGASPWLCGLAADLSAAGGSAPLESFFREQAARVLPVLGTAVSFVYTSWLYSFWAFNARWKLEGVSVVDRLRNIECDWAFYFGFGAPLTACTFFNPFFVNVALYSLGFPWLVVLATAVMVQDGEIREEVGKTSVRRRRAAAQYGRLPIFRLSRWSFDALRGWLSRGVLGRRLHAE